MATEPALAEGEKAEEQPASRPAGLDLNVRLDEEEELAADEPEAPAAVAAGSSVNVFIVLSARSLLNEFFWPAASVRQDVW